MLRMAPEHVEDGGIVVVQQKTGKELWVPVHPDLRCSLEAWRSSPYVVNGRGVRFTAERFRATWAELMAKMPAGRIRDEGFVFHGLRASSCEKLREVGCNDREIGAIDTAALLIRRCSPRQQLVG